MTLISPNYRDLQQQMHAMPRGYGGINADTYGAAIKDFIDEHGIIDVLDYGAGKGHVGEYLFTHGYRGSYHPYDPAIPHWAKSPVPADMVLCIDVLEHIEPDLLDNVLDDLQRVMRRFGIFSIHHRRANKTLPDGRNAHLIIQPPEWWYNKVGEYFKINKTDRTIGKNDGELLSTIHYVEALS